MEKKEKVMKNSSSAQIVSIYLNKEAWEAESEQSNVLNLSARY